MDFSKVETENFIEEIIKRDLLSGKAKEVITRCPPEPSGYWHIGHCKAWIVNFETALKFGGYTYLRMDDTNPKKEDGDFVSEYENNLRWLGYEPKAVIYSSVSYFEKIYELAVGLIKKGLAYVDELSPEETSRMRGTLTTPGENSPYRERPIEESLDLFARMRAGEFPDGKMTLRAKIDMASPNIYMRDPVMYRIIHTAHYKTGDKWCIYPSYGFAHPMEDCLEGITFSLCDMSFEEQRPLYEWFVEHTWGKPFPPRQIEFYMLNLENVLLGKRYIKILVNEKKVMGWDDPRLLTIVGMIRRGYTAQGIKNFVKALGVSKSESYIPLSTLEYYIRGDLNEVATRAMVVLDPLKVIITNYDKEAEECSLENNPNDPKAGTHKMYFGREIYIEKEDFSSNPPPKYNRLVLGGMVRLKGAYIIKCNKINYDKAGNIESLECEYISGTKSGEDNSGIKVKGTIHFVESSHMREITIRNFKNIIKDSVKDPVKELSAGANLDDILNTDETLTEQKAYAEGFLANAKAGDKFQFIRKGYFCVDTDSDENNLIFNNTIPLKDGYKP